MNCPTGLCSGLGEDGAPMDEYLCDQCAKESLAILELAHRRGVPGDEVQRWWSN